MEIRMPERLAEYLVLRDPLAIQSIKKHLKQSGSLGLYQKLLQKSWWTYGGYLTVILAAFFAFYWWAIPPLADHASGLIPKSWQENLGAQVLVQMVSEEAVNTEASQALNDFVQTLELPESEFNIELIVLDSKEKNAFALPSGHIVVYEGLLSSINSPDQLIALLGHEIAHVQESHAMKMMTRNLMGYLLVSIVFSDVNGIFNVLAENANGLRHLSFSRGFERQADRGALRVLSMNGCSAQGLIDLLELLKGHGDHLVPEFLSTHPHLDDRIEWAQKDHEPQKLPCPLSSSTMDSFKKLKP